MSNFSLITTLVVLSIAFAAAPVAGQPATATATNATDAPATPTSPQPTPAASTSTGERIDRHTVIVRSRYLENESVALVTIRSERPQSVTFSDAGAFIEGGEVATRTIVVGDETTTVEIPVTEVDGRVGVGISTRVTPLYSEIIESGGGGLQILSAVSPLQAWLGGVVIAFVWTIIAGFSVLRGEEGRPEVA